MKIITFFFFILNCYFKENNSDIISNGPRKLFLRLLIVFIIFLFFLFWKSSWGEKIFSVIFYGIYLSKFWTMFLVLKFYGLGKDGAVFQIRRKYSLQLKQLFRFPNLVLTVWSRDRFMNCFFIITIITSFLQICVSSEKSYIT